MPTLRDLTAEPSGFLICPRHGEEVCGSCFNTTRGFDRCYACSRNEQYLDAMVPISYSVAHERLHQALASYKRGWGLEAERATRELGAILWRFLLHHETCVAGEAAVSGFDLVTTVPSSDVQRDEAHPLRRVVGELVAPTRDRHQRVLRRTEHAVAARKFDDRRFEATRELSGLRVLLIDDTWTTGASAQSAACALKVAGAAKVASVVLGRHLNREWHQNDRHLRDLARSFDWSECAFCSGRQGARQAA